MIARRCYRHLDRPFVVFLGLGPADLVAILIAGTILMIAVNPVVGLFGAVGMGFGAKRLKEGKPRGHVFGLLYRMGLVAFLPPAARPPYLVKPPSLGGRGVLRLSAVPGPEDDESPEARFWRGSRRFVA